MKTAGMCSALIILCICVLAHAGFGGSRGGSSSSRSSSSSYSSPSRSSSFGGSRSTYRAPIVRPTSPSGIGPSSRMPVYAQPNTTVIHHDSGGGFWTGMMIGSLFNRPQVVVAAQPGQLGVATGNHIADPEESTGWTIFWVIIFGGLIFFVIYAIREARKC